MRRRGARGWAAVAVIVALAVGTVGDLDWLSAQERAGELRTLRAMGWPAREMARLAVAGAALRGAAGGLLAGALAVAVGHVAGHPSPMGNLAVMAAALGVGVAISVAAAGASALVSALSGRL
jgi:hypothetical protein